MSRCVSCNTLIEYETNTNPDLCWTCSDIIRKTVSEKTPLFPTEYVHHYAHTGVTPIKKSAYES